MNCLNLISSNSYNYTFVSLQLNSPRNPNHFLLYFLSGRKGLFSMFPFQFPEPWPCSDCLLDVKHSQAPITFCLASAIQKPSQVNEWVNLLFLRIKSLFFFQGVRDIQTGGPGSCAVGKHFSFYFVYSVRGCGKACFPNHVLFQAVFVRLNNFEMKLGVWVRNRKAQCFDTFKVSGNK